MIKGHEPWQTTAKAGVPEESKSKPIVSESARTIANNNAAWEQRIITDAEDRVKKTQRRAAARVFSRQIQKDNYHQVMDSSLRTWLCNLFSDVVISSKSMKLKNGTGCVV